MRRPRSGSSGWVLGVFTVIFGAASLVGPCIGPSFFLGAFFFFLGCDLTFLVRVLFALTVTMRADSILAQFSWNSSWAVLGITTFRL